MFFFFFLTKTVRVTGVQGRRRSDTSGLARGLRTHQTVLVARPGRQSHVTSVGRVPRHRVQLGRPVRAGRPVQRAANEGRRLPVLRHGQQRRIARHR